MLARNDNHIYKEIHAFFLIFYVNLHWFLLFPFRYHVYHCIQNTGFLKFLVYVPAWRDTLSEALLTAQLLSICILVVLCFRDSHSFFLLASHSVPGFLIGWLDFVSFLAIGCSFLLFFSGIGWAGSENWIAGMWLAEMWRMRVLSSPQFVKQIGQYCEPLTVVDWPEKQIATF